MVDDTRATMFKSLSTGQCSTVSCVTDYPGTEDSHPGTNTSKSDLFFLRSEGVRESARRRRSPVRRVIVCEGVRYAEQALLGVLTPGNLEKSWRGQFVPPRASSVVAQME